MFRISKLIVVGALALSLGLHWILLQSAAWVGMAVNFSRTDSIGEALTKTFDGQHPCKLCKLVQEGQQAEKKQEPKQTSAKFDLFSVASAALIFPPEREVMPPAPRASVPFAPQSPPVPPPRAV